jgi:hypothetical protein
MARLDAQRGEDGAVEALGGGEVGDREGDVVEHPAEATVAGMLDLTPSGPITIMTERGVVGAPYGCDGLGTVPLMPSCSACSPEELL